MRTPFRERKLSEKENSNFWKRLLPLPVGTRIRIRGSLSPAYREEGFISKTLFLENVKEWKYAVRFVSGFTRGWFCYEELEIIDSC